VTQEEVQQRLQQKADGGGFDAKQRICGGRALHAAESAVEEEGQKHKDDRYGMRLHGDECVGKRIVGGGGRGGTGTNCLPVRENA
jgi:hypothetical protein